MQAQLSTTLMTFAAEDPGSWKPMLEKARAADAAGIDRVVVSDHVCYGENLEAYSRPELGGSEGGKQPTGPDGHWLEPITVLSVVAGQTERLRLGTNILLAALRRPLVLAKTLATLDVLSEGRLDIGVGVGWQKEEYDAAGLSFDDRGRQLDHTLEVCQTLWRNTRAQYSSPELTFENIHQMPKPRQAGGVPIWVSGTVNQRVIRRLATFGSAWIPWGPSASDLATSIPQIKAGLEKAGYDAANLQVVGNLKPLRDGGGKVDYKATVATAPELVKLGVTDCRLAMVPPEGYDAARNFYGEIVEAFRKAVG